MNMANGPESAPEKPVSEIKPTGVDQYSAVSDDDYKSIMQRIRGSQSPEQTVTLPDLSAKAMQEIVVSMRGVPVTNEQKINLSPYVRNKNTAGLVISPTHTIPRDSNANAYFAVALANPLREGFGRPLFEALHKYFNGELAIEDESTKNLFERMIGVTPSTRKSLDFNGTIYARLNTYYEALDSIEKLKDPDFNNVINPTDREELIKQNKIAVERLARDLPELTRQVLAIDYIGNTIEDPNKSLERLAQTNSE